MPLVNADLVNGKAIVSSYYAGKAVILTRNQDNTTAIGNVYIYSPSTIDGVSFEIRSTNISDNGTVYWQIVEELESHPITPGSNHQ